MSTEQKYVINKDSIDAICSFLLNFIGLDWTFWNQIFWILLLFIIIFMSFSTFSFWLWKQTCDVSFLATEIELMLCFVRFLSRINIFHYQILNRFDTKFMDINIHIHNFWIWAIIMNKCIEEIFWQQYIVIKFYLT